VEAPVARACRRHPVEAAVAHVAVAVVVAAEAAGDSL
jgi:hypothetical protein